MGKRYGAPLRITLLTNCLVLLLSFAGVTSVPVITSVMKNDSVCEASKFLYDLTYIQDCTTYPVSRNLSLNLHLGDFLCLGLYDTTYKLCQYSSQHLLNISANVSVVFDSQVKKLAATGNNKKVEFCNNLQGYTPLNKTEYLQELSKNINSPDSCRKICFDLSDKLYPLCAVLGWIKNVDDSIKKELAERRHDSAVPTNTETMSDNKTAEGAKKTSEIKETKDQASKPTVTASKVKVNEGDDIKGNNPNASDNTLITVAKVNADEVKSEKNDENETSKKLEKTPDHKTIVTSTAVEGDKEDVVNPGASIVQVAKPTKNPPVNNNPPQTAPAKELAGNAPKEIMNPENAQEPDTDGFKASTISQNTQDDMNDTNLEEEMESNRGDNIDDIDDMISQQIDINKEPLSKESQNILQEASEQKDNNLQYSSASIEEESHFFTYFTVITVACIAGYIGYHNKQKILAIVLEGRRSRSRGRRRPSTANYRKLDCTLEEAVTSQCNANVTHVIY